MKNFSLKSSLATSPSIKVLNTFHIHLSLLFIIFAMAITQNAFPGNVTFNAGSNSGSTSITVAPIRMSIKN